MVHRCSRHERGNIIRIGLKNFLDLRGRLLRLFGLVPERDQGEETPRVLGPGKCGACFQGVFHRRLRFDKVANAVLRPRQVVEDLRTLAQGAGTFLKQADRPFEIAGLISEASEKVRDGAVVQSQFSGGLRQSQRLFRIVKAIGIEAGKLEGGRNIFRVLFQGPLIEIARLLNTAIALENRAQPRERHRVIRLFSQSILQQANRFGVGRLDIDTQHSEPAFGLLFAGELLTDLEGALQGDSGRPFLSHHVMGHTQVKLNFRAARQFFRALLKQTQSPRILAAFIEDPAKCVRRIRFIRKQVLGAPRHLIRIFETSKPL